MIKLTLETSKEKIKYNGKKMIEKCGRENILKTNSCNSVVIQSIEEWMTKYTNKLVTNNIL